MKTRSDFVSNSSSSSFVVLADKNTPAIFKDELLSFSEFQKRFFWRDVVEDMRCNLTWPRRNAFGGDVFGKIRFMSPGEFAAEYVRLGDGVLSFSGTYPVLRSDRKLVGRLRALADEYSALDEMPVTVYRRGKPDGELRLLAEQPVRRLTDECEDRINDVLDEITGHFLDVVKDRMSGWKFWYAELDDSEEEAGYAALREDGVKWGRVFSNH